MIYLKKLTTKNRKMANKQLMYYLARYVDKLLRKGYQFYTTVQFQLKKQCCHNAAVFFCRMVTPKLDSMICQSIGHTMTYRSVYTVNVLMLMYCLYQLNCHIGLRKFKTKDIPAVIYLIFMFLIHLMYLFIFF